jgi:hypothetical protein
MGRKEGFAGGEVVRHSLWTALGIYEPGNLCESPHEKSSREGRAQYARDRLGL